jgi:hypothetical protein
MFLKKKEKKKETEDLRREMKENGRTLATYSDSANRKARPRQLKRTETKEHVLENASNLSSPPAPLSEFLILREFRDFASSSNASTISDKGVFALVVVVVVMLASVASSSTTNSSCASCCCWLYNVVEERGGGGIIVDGGGFPFINDRFLFFHTVLFCLLNLSRVE